MPPSLCPSWQQPPNHERVYLNSFPQEQVDISGLSSRPNKSVVLGAFPRPPALGAFWVPGSRIGRLTYKARRIRDTDLKQLCQAFIQVHSRCLGSRSAALREKLIKTTMALKKEGCSSSSEGMWPIAKRGNEERTPLLEPTSYFPKASTGSPTNALCHSQLGETLSRVASSEA